MRLGMAIGARLPRRSGPAVVPVGGVLSVVIADATPIDPVSSIGASGSGCVAAVTLKGIVSLVGTVDASKLTIQVSDPGFDSSGNAVTVSRTIVGNAHLRRQYPNGASKMISTDGTNVTMLIVLDDVIYTGTTIVSAAIASGFYPSSVASSSPVCTNQSTQGYIPPQFSWLNAQQESCGNTFNVEAVAFNWHGQNGQQIACMKYNATDGTTTTADVLVSAPTLSAKQTQGNIAECWAGTLDMSTLSQGTMCTVNAKVYPWLGTMFDVGASGTAWPTARPITKLRVLCDRTGGYGGGYGYVKVGASGGIISATPATARAAPFPTITAAMAALKTWNNTNRSHNDFGGGFIRLMDDGAGGAQLHTIATAPANSPGLTWLTVEADPLNTGATSVTFSAQCSFPSLMRWRTKLVPSAQTHNYIGNDTADEMIWLDGGTIDNTANKTIVSWYRLKYIDNLTLTGGNSCNFNGLAATNNGLSRMMGIVGTTTSTTTNQPFVLIGCTLPRYSVTRSTTTQGNHGRIVYNNKIQYAVYEKLSTGETVLDGIANAQNLYEHDNAASVVSCMNWFADADLTTIVGYLDVHNTAVGNRASQLYNDNTTAKVAPNGTVKIGRSMYSLYDNTNKKDDRFTSGIGSVGAWMYQYGVGNFGNVGLFGAVNRAATDLPHNDNGDTPYMGSAWHPSSEPNLFRTAYGFTQAQIMDDNFTNYTVAPRAVPALGGNYKPKSTATYIKNRVPAGKSVFKWDIDGTLRRTDGTGAAGAYESA